MPVKSMPPDDDEVLSSASQKMVGLQQQHLIRQFTDPAIPETFSDGDLYGIHANL